MASLPYDLDHLIQALATPWGEGALAVTRVSGPDCLKVLSRGFSRPEKLQQAPGHSLVHGWLLDPESGRRVDEVLISVFRAPHSYTGQESAEISSHGGLTVIRGVAKALKKMGFRDAAPGEFTFRAYAGGKMDLTQAEAVHEVVTSHTDQARSLALSRLGGSVYKAVDGVKEDVTRLAATAALALDYPEEEAEPVPLERKLWERSQKRLGDLLATWRTGRLYKEGLKVALAGPANAGKSSLFNLFLKEERSIVTPVPGTTRDYLEAWVDLEGLPLRLFDTAGLRESTLDPVEQEGVRRTKILLESADIILYVVDGETGEGRAEAGSFLPDSRDPGEVILLWNKSDTAPPAPEGFLPVSAKTGAGFSSLEKELQKRAFRGGASPAGEAPVIDSLRQKELLEKALESLDRFAGEMNRPHPPLDLLAEDLREVLDFLGEITGEVTSTDILKRLFSDFCVGK